MRRAGIRAGALVEWEGHWFVVAADPSGRRTLLDCGSFVDAATCKLLLSAAATITEAFEALCSSSLLSKQWSGNMKEFGSFGIEIGETYPGRMEVAMFQSELVKTGNPEYGPYIVNGPYAWPDSQQATMRVLHNFYALCGYLARARGGA